MSLAPGLGDSRRKTGRADMDPAPAIALDYRFEKVRLKSRRPSNAIERFGALAGQSVSISPSLVRFLPVGRAERITGGSLDPGLFRAQQAVDLTSDVVRLRLIEHEFEAAP